MGLEKNTIDKKYKCKQILSFQHILVCVCFFMPLFTLEICLSEFIMSSAMVLTHFISTYFVGNQYVVEIYVLKICLKFISDSEGPFALGDNDTNF